ncbi:hypothetical protein ACLOJK_026303 [Asimina triloba]
MLLETDASLLPCITLLPKMPHLAAILKIALPYLVAAIVACLLLKMERLTHDPSIRLRSRCLHQSRTVCPRSNCLDHPSVSNRPDRSAGHQQAIQQQCSSPAYHLRSSLIRVASNSQRHLHRSSATLLCPPPLFRLRLPLVCTRLAQIQHRRSLLASTSSQQHQIVSPLVLHQQPTKQICPPAPTTTLKSSSSPTTLSKKSIVVGAPDLLQKPIDQQAVIGSDRRSVQRSHSAWPAPSSSAAPLLLHEPSAPNR